MNYSYNRFDTLRYETECYKCNNFGHVSINFPMSFQKFNEPTYTYLKTKYWKKKSENLNIEKCTIALQAEHKVKWVVDSGFSNHMTGRKQLFVELDEGKEGTVTFVNDQSTRIVGKGIVYLNNKKIMAENAVSANTRRIAACIEFAPPTIELSFVYMQKGSAVRMKRANTLSA